MFQTSAGKSKYRTCKEIHALLYYEAQKKALEFSRLIRSIELFEKLFPQFKKGMKYLTLGKKILWKEKNDFITYFYYGMTSFFFVRRHKR